MRENGMPKRKKNIFGSKHTGYVTGEGVASTIAPSSEDIGTVGEPVPKAKDPDLPESPEEARVRELQDEIRAEAARIEAEKQASGEMEPVPQEGKSASWTGEDSRAASGTWAARRDSSHSRKGESNSIRGFRPVESKLQFEGRYAHIGEAPQSRTEQRKDDRGRRSQRSLEREPSEEIAGEVTVFPRMPQEASEYDDLVNWKARLAREAPLYSRAFSLCNAHTMLELGSGCGQRSVMFAEWGLDVIAVDSDRANVEKARLLAERHRPAIEEPGGVVRFATLDFESVSDILGGKEVDAIVCVGDMLSQVTSLDQLRSLLQELSNMLVPSGVLVLDLVNNTHYIQQKIRSTTPEVFDTVDGTRIFFDVMDYPAGSSVFTSDRISLTRDESGAWSTRSSRTQHLFISSAGITHELFDVGFDIQEIAGDYTGRALRQYDDERIVVIARRKRHRTV